MSTSRVTKFCHTGVDHDMPDQRLHYSMLLQNDAPQGDGGIADERQGKAALRRHYTINLLRCVSAGPIKVSRVFLAPSRQVSQCCPDSFPAPDPQGRAHHLKSPPAAPMSPQTAPRCLPRLIDIR